MKESHVYDTKSTSEQNLSDFMADVWIKVRLFCLAIFTEHWAVPCFRGQNNIYRATCKYSIYLSNYPPHTTYIAEGSKFAYTNRSLIS